MIDNEELSDESALLTSKLFLPPEDNDHSVDPETQARLEALLQAAGLRFFLFILIILVYVFVWLLMLSLP